ncbi:MAG: GatB/YqeY domain-containing protein [Alphaproteobacteria bacterium]|nr:GatB/YqeY domain-containing protein [Alphaproteobacteria bacterium]
MLRDDLQNGLKEAMKNRDMETVSAIRLIIAGQKEKDVEARGKGLEKASDADLLAMMQTMIKQRNESVKIYKDGNREDLAAKELSEINVITRFLPKQLNTEEMEKAIKDAIASTGAASIKDMGKVMGILKSQYAGQMDFGAASAIIKKFLA